jgi:FkbM family methyltransferase
MLVRERQGYWLPEPHAALSISVFAQHNGLDLIPEARQRLRGSSIIDGGAFVGDSALIMSEFQPEMIYCFEPDETNRSYLLQTIAHSGLKSVTVVEAGLGSADGRATVKSDASQSTLSHGTGIQVMTLDTFCAERNVSPALIKLDVEGMEYGIVQSGLETIKKHKPLLIISIYHTPKDFFEIKPMLEKLDVGYRFMVRRLDPFHPTNETVLIGY